MIATLRERRHLAAMALCAAMLLTPMAAADDTAAAAAVPNKIEPGPIAADDLNENFDHLVRLIGELNAEIDGLKSSGDEPSVRHPLIREEKAFGDPYLAASDGLVIAFFTVKAAYDPQGSLQARVTGNVDPDVQHPDHIKLSELRATDSFLAVKDSNDRSAAIIMPVFTNEYYNVELSITHNSVPIEFDPDEQPDFIGNVYFMSFAVAENIPPVQSE